MWVNINKTQSILGNKICADMMGNGCFSFYNFSVTLRADVTKLSLGYGDGAVGTLGDGQEVETTTDMSRVSDASAGGCPSLQFLKLTVCRK
jgi:hypothetical protein